MRARPMGGRAFAHSMRPSVRRRGPVGRFADNLRQIAQGRESEKAEENPSWFNPKLAAVALAFFAMVGFRGDDVIENLTDDE